VTPVTGEGLAHHHGVLLLAGVLWALGCTFLLVFCGGESLERARHPRLRAVPPEAR
jgi:hypothetical protein